MNGKILNKEALKAWILSKMVTLTNNLLATTPGISAMDAAQGPVIQGQIDAINSNFGGCAFGMTEDGQPGFRKPGADTVMPFSKHDVKASNRGATSNSQNHASISITVPVGVKRGLLICESTGWGSAITQSTPSGSGIKAIVSNNYSVKNTDGACSGYVSLYKCEFNEGGTITLSYGNTSSTGYATGQFILIA